MAQRGDQFLWEHACAKHLCKQERKDYARGTRCAFPATQAGTPMASPVLGYNTNVRHQNKVFHIQTEDSGTQHAHIFTHLFADGGRIIATKKTSYAEFLATAEFQVTVKRLMQAQHKAMFIALRDGLFDADERKGAEEFAKRIISLEDSAERQTGDVEAFERVAQEAETHAESSSSGQVLPPKERAKSKLPPPPPPPAAGPARYGEAKPALAPGKSSSSLFGASLVSERSLDEVIMSYLADETDQKK